MKRPDTVTEENEREFLRILGGDAQQITQKAAELLNFLKPFSRDAQKYLVAILLTKYSRSEIKSERRIMGPLIDERRFEDLTRTYGDLVNATIRLILIRRMNPEEAAQRILDLLDGFTGDEKEFALAYVMADKAVPYSVLPPHPTEPMTEGIANTLLSRVREKQEAIRIIERAEFEVPTEAQLLLQLIESEPDQKTKEALLAWIIWRQRSKAETVRSRIMEMVGRAI